MSRESIQMQIEIRGESLRMKRLGWIEANFDALRIQIRSRKVKLLIVDTIKLKI